MRKNRKFFIANYFIGIITIIISITLVLQPLGLARAYADEQIGSPPESVQVESSAASQTEASSPTQTGETSQAQTPIPVNNPEPKDEPRPTPKSPVNGITRISGNDGYLTSIKIADALKKELGVSKFKTIVLASGKNFPDALTASAFAARKLAPVILLPGGKNANAVNYVKNNLAKDGTIYIVGGTQAIPQSLVNSVKDYGNVIRIAGGTRYGTNIEILKKMNLPKGTNLIVASGKSFQDALAASATGLPILIVDKNIGAGQMAYLKNVITGSSKVYIVGGKIAVSDTVEYLRNMSPVWRDLQEGKRSFVFPE